MLPVRDKLLLLRIARLLRQGALLAHDTGTLPGIAAAAGHRKAAIRLCRFKQRKGPFLLLADSQHTALRLSIYLPGALRRAMLEAWPGPTTFILPSAGVHTKIIASACFSGRSIAVRVDADVACRYLARLVGGFLISSSLNRKNQPVQRPDRRLRMRWQRYLGAQFSSLTGSGNASSLLKWTGSRLISLRQPEPPQN
jgi:L-threonylcarbamoyladenylate synthase